MNSQQSQIVRQLLCTALENASFIPFLGSGASSLRFPSEKCDVWDDVAERIGLLSGALSDEQDRSYLRAMAEAHSVQLSPVVTPPDGAGQDHLLVLQLALIHLGSYLVRLFGEEMARDRSCVADLLDYQVEVERTDPTLLSLCLDAADAALDLANSQPNSVEDPKRSILATKEIYDKLLLFLKRIVDTDPEEFCQEFRLERHRSTLENLRLICPDDRQGVPNKPLRLRLDELAWFADLSWHTLRFSVPAYPSTTELAFRLGLAKSFLILRRAELPQVAQLHGEGGSQELIHDWLEFCERGRQEPSRFHRAVAAAVYHVYEEWSRARSKTRESDVYTECHCPLVFTTNYDRLLEKAFEDEKVIYHLVYPVLGMMGHSENLLWLLYTVKPGRGGGERQGPQDCRDCGLSDIQEKIRGPVIVKLHGSPLDVLPDSDEPLVTLHSRDSNVDRDQEPRFRAFKHFLVLSESSYLQTVVDRTAFPRWVEDGLKGRGRRLWFLGYSISDWNVRLRLYEQLSHVPEDEAQSDRLRVAMDRQYDELRGAILEDLKVEFHRGELESFAALLERVPEVARILEHWERAKGRGGK